MRAIILAYIFGVALIWIIAEYAIQIETFRRALALKDYYEPSISSADINHEDKFAKALQNAPVFNYVHPSELPTSFEGPFERIVTNDGPWDMRPPGKTMIQEFRRVNKKGQVLYSIPATVNADGQRVVPDTNENASKQLVLLGCSILFGESVEDQHTLAAFLQKELDQHQVVNLALNGHGPNGIFAELQGPAPRLKNIKTKPGATLYFHDYDHLRRLECRGNCFFKPINQWIWSRPWLRRNTQGQIEVAGTLRDRNSQLFSISPLDWIVSKSSLLSYFNMALPPVESPAALEFFADTIAAIKKLSHEKFGTERFVFVIYPSGHPSDKRIDELIRERGIETLNYSSRPIDGSTFGKSKIKYDGHPHPRAQYILSQWIVDDLFKKTADKQ